MLCLWIGRINIYEEMFNIPSHKGNGNQNVIEIPSHTSQNDNYQDKKQQMLVMIWEKEPLYTIGRYVNQCSPYGN
jgi:hypothetical protein